MRLGRGGRAPFLLAAGLFVLLGILATLQYRWLGQVSEAELQRMRASLSTAAAHFADDFDREIARAFVSFEIDPRLPSEEIHVRLAQQYDRWISTSLSPRLIRDLLFARGQEGREVAVERFDPSSRRWEAATWPAGLDTAWRRMETRERRWPPWAGEPRGSLIAPELPALLIPLPNFSAGVSRRATSDEEIAPVHTALIVRFDLDYIREILFPALATRYFSTPRGLDEVITVVARSGSQSPIYRSEQRVTGPIGNGDASAELLSLRRTEEFPGVLPEAANLSPQTGVSEAGASGRSRDRLAGASVTPFPRTFPHRGFWRLVVTHRAESLEAVVARARRHNLGVAFGILAVLASSVAMISVSARRAQLLARQQIEFVAGVTHELNTPLTVIRSAAQNLADGVVGQPAQIRQYGALIEGEGRRLSEMVTRVLEFAGMQSAHDAYRMRPVSVEQVVQDAVARCRSAAEQKDFRIETVIAQGLPPVLADPAALTRALQNLIENAIKYGAAQRWARIRATSAQVRGMPGVAITVEDRGTGIREADLPRIFEPFYRGENAIAGAVAGSGLGLSLVKHIADAHGGQITVATDAGGTGASFTLRLRAAAESAAAEPARAEP